VSGIGRDLFLLIRILVIRIKRLPRSQRQFQTSRVAEEMVTLVYLNLLISLAALWLAG
jgi:hypothetical protein